MESSPGAIIAVDVDNLLISSAAAGQDFFGYDLRAGFENMFAWVRTFADIVCLYLYLPMDQCIKNDELFQELWEKYRKEFIFELIYCPKKRSQETGKLVDDVDQHLIDHTKRMVDLLYPAVTFFCLASGDLDYSPLLWELKRKEKLEIAFAIGSERSFSGAYRQMNLVAKHPSTGKELIHYFLPREQ
ncbi:MAG: hypothetical protein AAB352_03135 [Patescibacteria group bacterium]